MPERGRLHQQERMSVPDDEVMPWMKTLRDNGFSDEEIDRMLTWLNAEYARVKLPEIVDTEVKKVLERMRQHDEGTLSRQEIEKLRDAIRKDLRPR